MAEFEPGPINLPSSVRNALAYKLRRGSFYPNSQFDQNGCFGIVAQDFQQGEYFSARLLSFDPLTHRLHKYVDRTYYVIPGNVDQGDENSFIGKLRIGAAEALTVPFGSIRPVNRLLSGNCFVNEDGDLHLQSGNHTGSERFTLRVEPSGNVGAVLYRVVFDAIEFEGTRRYIRPDGVAILKDSQSGQRRLVPRQIIINS